VEETGFFVARSKPARRGTAHRTTAAWLAALALAACGGEARDPETAAPIGVMDDAGRTVRLDRPARRVISMVPAQTAIVATLAGADVLVARTVWDTDPRLQHLPSIGNALNPSVEWLAAQQPDLVIAWPDAQSRDVIQRLTEIGIPAYASRVESVDGIRGMIERLGTLLGVDARADSLIDAIDATLDTVRTSVEARPRQRVLYLLSVDPPMVAGPGTYVDDLITIAGGDNVFGDLRQLWPQVSLEEIVRRDPDVIIRPSGRPPDVEIDALRQRAGWRTLRAVHDRRVHVVDPDLYNRPGATVGSAARGLADRIHAPASGR
jgi:iron complex transport system substrate-binding protein